MAWTDITRRQHRRERLRYPSDLTDAEWAVIAPLLPPARRGGRPRRTDLREVVNGILYLATGGCQWRLLPRDFPPLSTVQHYFYAWRDSGLWQSINHLLVSLADRLRIGRVVLPALQVRCGCNSMRSPTTSPTSCARWRRPRRSRHGR